MRIEQSRLPVLLSRHLAVPGAVSDERGRVWVAFEGFSPPRALELPGDNTSQCRDTAGTSALPRPAPPASSHDTGTQCHSHVTLRCYTPSQGCQPSSAHAPNVWGESALPVFTQNGTKPGEKNQRDNSHTGLKIAPPSPAQRCRDQEPSRLLPEGSFRRVLQWTPRQQFTGHNRHPGPAGWARPARQVRRSLHCRQPDFPSDGTEAQLKHPNVL